MARPAQVTISISTSSQEIPLSSPLPSPALPKITVNDVPVPDPGAPDHYPSGVQIVVINSTGDLSDPAAIISDKCSVVTQDAQQGWSDTYRNMFDDATNQVLGAGDPQQQLVIVATYGMDLGMFPTPDFVELMLSLGAGPQLQQWINTAVPSESGDWVDYPVDYVLVGSPGYGYGGASEKFDYAGGEGTPVQTSLSVTLENNPEPPTAPT